MFIQIDVPSHLNKEFGKCQKDILNTLEFLRDRISSEEWELVRETVFNNVNSIKRNVFSFIGATVKEAFNVKKTSNIG